MKKLSVIIPVYNVLDYLDQCLASVCGQTMQDMEIICVNDGSADGSDKILERWAQKDSRIQIINQENAGLSAARNTGLKYATGDYVTFLDSDDWVAPDFYQNLFDSAVQNDADMSVGNVIYYHNYAKMYIGFVSFLSFKMNKPVLTTPIDKQYIIQSCAVWHKIYRRNLLNDNNLRFYFGKNVEDFPFTFVAVALANKVVCCPFVNLYYRQRSTSIMHDSRQQNKNVFDVFDNLKQLRQDCEYFGINKNPIYNDLLLNLTIQELFSWSEKLVDRHLHKQYMRDAIAYIKTFKCNDINLLTPLNRMSFKTINNTLLNMLFRIKYNAHKIEFWFLGVPVFKIKKNNEDIKWMLGCFLSVYTRNIRGM